MGVKFGEAKGDARGGYCDYLTREQERKLRADAWRYVRRINPRVARAVWSNHVGLNRYAKRKDANQKAIIQALESVGAEVWVTDRPADLMVWFRQKWYVAEVKAPKGKLTKLQQAERDEGLCQGIMTWRTGLEALESIGAIARNGPVICQA